MYTQNLDANECSECNLLVNANGGKCDACSDKPKSSENGQTISRTDNANTKSVSQKKSRSKKSNTMTETREKLPSSSATTSSPSLSTREESGVCREFVVTRGF